MEADKETTVLIIVDEYQEMIRQNENVEQSPEEGARREEASRVLHEIFLMGRANPIEFPIGEASS